MKAGAMKSSSFVHAVISVIASNVANIFIGRCTSFFLDSLIVHYWSINAMFKDLLFEIEKYYVFLQSKKSLL